jgi:hypothetical protein
MIHSVEKGVSRRNPTELISTLAGINGNSFVYSYERGDEVEEYIIFIASGEVKVFDTEGVERIVVADTNALAYLTLSVGVNAQTAFKAITVGDTTFIVNKTIETAMSSTIQGVLDSHMDHPFYWVKRSFDNGGGTGYSYSLQGQSTNTTSTSSACVNLASLLGADYTAYGSIVYSNTKPSSYVWGDSYGDQASQGFWGTAKSITDLPRTMHGIELSNEVVIEVQGDPENAFTNFWVEFEDGTWKETVKRGIANTIDSHTMPIKLVSLADGTFSLELITYADRRVGDENTASEPSFIGRTISDMFFFKNRLCLVSGENVIMSEIAKYFNFFPTTVTDTLDSDPIDVAVDTNAVSLLNHAVPFNNSVVLSSTGGQFSLQSDKVLSPNDATITSTTSYNAVRKVRPISLGSSMYFLSEDLKGVALREYFVDSSGESNLAVDVSSHVSGYIPVNIKAMVGNTNQDIIILMPDSSNELYIYKFYTNGNERIQTAWFKWVFSGTIKGITMLGKHLYLVIDRGEGTQLERLDYSTSSEGTVYLDNGNIEYESSLLLSETVLKDANDKVLLTAGSPLMYKTLQLKSTEDSLYTIEVTNKLRTREATGFAVSDSKILLRGRTNEVSLKIKSVGESPLEFHTYTTELLYNTRASNV